MTEPTRPFLASQDPPTCPDRRDGHRCPRAPAPGFNPTGRCEEHLAAYRARMSAPTDLEGVRILDFTGGRRMPILPPEDR